MRMQINKTYANPPNLSVPELGAVNLMNNPYAERPSTAQQHVIFDADQEKSLKEMDNLLNAPMSVEISIWTRFVHVRRDKIHGENNLKWRNILLNEMNAYMQKRIDEEEQKKKEIDEYAKSIQM
jgi:hypothetical protein